MLDLTRLSTNPRLIQSDWSPAYPVQLEQRYHNVQQTGWAAQVELDQVFSAARDIIETLDGIIIPNLHPELGLGHSCSAIEFDFFQYDSHCAPILRSIEKKLGKKVLFIGIGYDIIGDWLVDEVGAIHFQNKLKNRLHLVSKNIYDFLSGDIDKLEDVYGTPFLS